jgi:hypothetical protein
VKRGVGSLLRTRVSARCDWSIAAQVTEVFRYPRDLTARSWLRQPHDASAFFLNFRQRSEQYFTSSQFLAHALRHVIGRPQVTQIFSGSTRAFMSSAELIGADFALVLLDGEHNASSHGRRIKPGRKLRGLA